MGDMFLFYIKTFTDYAKRMLTYSLDSGLTNTVSVITIYVALTTLLINFIVSQINTLAATATIPPLVVVLWKVVLPSNFIPCLVAIYTCDLVCALYLAKFNVLKAAIKSARVKQTA